MRENEAVKINITFKKDGEETEMEAEGNGSLSAINHALSEFTGEDYTLREKDMLSKTYTEVA